MAKIVRQTRRDESRRGRHECLRNESDLPLDRGGRPRPPTNGPGENRALRVKLRAGLPCRDRLRELLARNRVTNSRNYLFPSVSTSYKLISKSMVRFPRSICQKWYQKGPVCWAVGGAKATQLQRKNKRKSFRLKKSGNGSAPKSAVFGGIMRYQDVSNTTIDLDTYVGGKFWRFSGATA